MVSTALIVENDAPVRFLLRVLLEREGLSVTEAANGNEALVHLAKRRFDVIITDLMMPERSGYELLEMIGQPARRANVIVLTAVPRPDTAVTNHPAVHCVIRKPFDIAELTENVRAICQRHLLVVEDDEPARYLARRAMESAGYRVTTACDGAEALRQLAENAFDAVVVDLRLPTISGYDVIDHIASKPPCPPIVVLSVIEQPELRVPVDAILHKPEGFAMLVPTLRSVV
ncbi:MAG TPA: response regulator [Thermoanaerobaculia bacterium]|nr:response regulator [Thermoanaerobaculia bacterium]